MIQSPDSVAAGLYNGNAPIICQTKKEKKESHDVVDILSIISTYVHFSK